MRLRIIRGEAKEAIMHLNGISGAYGNWLGSIPLNPFSSGTPIVHKPSKSRKKFEGLYFAPKFKKLISARMCQKFSGRCLS